MLDQITDLCLAHFLCAFDPRSRKQKTKDVIEKVALSIYSADKVAEFLESRLTAFQQTLVEEFNARSERRKPLRFQISDAAGVGSVVEGYRSRECEKEIRFQNVLNNISAAEFEKLAAVILQAIGCDDVFFTPASHDQGVDAFGYQTIISCMPYGTTHNLTWIAQAKHYRRSQVTTGDVRELVGSKELLVAKVFSTVDERYKELTLRCFAPIAIALITTEEFPVTVRRLAERSGVFLFASSDLFHILSPMLRQKSVSGIRALLRAKEKSIKTLT